MCRIQYEDAPEKVVAYEETAVRELYDRNGLRIAEPISFGYWSGAYEQGGQNDRRDQDVVVAVKEAA